jgi:hypothetical protein
MKGHKGKYSPKNPSKYKGNPLGIVYRSSWELKMFNYMDRNPDVEWWSSEECVVPYKSPVDGKYHRYFPDIVFKRTDGKIFMVEIKPLKQTQEPVKRKLTKQYVNEVMTYSINQAKWNAASEYCRKKGWEFKVITEKEIYG